VRASCCASPRAGAFALEELAPSSARVRFPRDCGPARGHSRERASSKKTMTSLRSGGLHSRSNLRAPAPCSRPSSTRRRSSTRSLLSALPCSARTPPSSVFSRTTSSLSARSAGSCRGLLESRSPATGWAAADAIQTRAPVAIGDVEGAGPGASDPALAAGYRAFLAVPLVGSEGGTQGALSVYAKRPRTWQPEEVEALAALAGKPPPRSRARSYTARCPREGAERRHPRQHRRRDRGRRPRGSRRALERGGGADHRRARLGRDRPLDRAGPPTDSGVRRRQERGDRLLAIRRGDEDVWLSLTEAIMRDRPAPSPGDLRLQGHLGRAGRRADEVRLRHRGLTRAANALTSIYGFAETLLRKTWLFGEEERGRSSATSPPSPTADHDRRPASQRRAARHRRPPGQPRTDRCQGVVSEVVQTAEQAPAANGTTSSSIFRSLRSTPRPTATS